MSDFTPERLNQLTDHVWYYPAHPDPSQVEPVVGVIIAGDSTVLVDGGNSPRHARRIQAALDALAAPPVRHMIFTHFHWDHVVGAQVFDAPVTAHRLCREHLEAMKAMNWGPDYLRQRGEQMPRMVPVYEMLIDLIDWDTFELVLPRHVFDTTHEINLDGLTVSLEHVGGQHADDSVVVSADGVMFVGDCYYPPIGEAYHPDNPPDFGMVERLLAYGHRWYVPGHSDAVTPEAIREWLVAQG